MKRAVEIEPKRAELHDELGSLLAQASQTEDAAAEFSEALRFTAAAYCSRSAVDMPVTLM